MALDVYFYLQFETPSGEIVATYPKTGGITPPVPDLYETVHLIDDEALSKWRVTERQFVYARTSPQMAQGDGMLALSVVCTVRPEGGA